MQLQEIAEYIGATLEGEASFEVLGLSSLASAKASDVVFVKDKKHLAKLEYTLAQTAILPLSYADNPSLYRGNKLLVKDPYLAFAKVAQLFDAARSRRVEIHKTAVIAKSAKLDASVHVSALSVIGENTVLAAGVVIGSGCVVESGCTIGKESQLLANVSLLENTQVGEGCILHAGCVVGDDGFGYANDQGVWIKIPQKGKVIIGNNVEIGSNTTVDCGALEDTVIEDGVKLDNQIQIGHNVHVGAHTAIAGGTSVAGSVVIGKKCTIAGMVGIAGHLTIADGTHVAAMSMVSKSIKNTVQVSSGWPAQEISQWRKMVALVRRLPKLVDRVKILEDKLRDR